jgi:hypothetical protein
VPEHGNARGMGSAGAKEIVGPDETVPRAAAGSGPDPRGPYGVILRRMWERPDWRALSFHARALFVYLRTCPAGGLLGVFRFHPDDAADDLGIPAAAVGPALDELDRDGWIERSGRWLFVIDSFSSTPGMSLRNPKHEVAVRRALSLVPKGLAASWERVYVPNGYGNANPIANPIPNPDQNADGMADGMADHGDVDGRTLKDVNTGGKPATEHDRPMIEIPMMVRQPHRARRDVIEIPLTRTKS